MQGWWRASLVAAVLAGLASCQTMIAPAPRTVALAIEDVTVIDPESRRVLVHRSVYVDGGRIVAVAPARARKDYAARRTVDGGGRYLIPGLLDMHSHLFLPDPGAPTLNLMLANGVTGIREMSGDCWEVAGARSGCIGEFKALQAKIKAGEIPGPDLVSIASPMVMGPASAQVPKGVDSFIVPRTPEEARRLARYLKSRGADLIKTHDSLTLPVFAALGDEAGRLGFETAGHVPFGVAVTALARHNFRSIEHARDLLYDCSRYGAEFRRSAGAFAEGKAAKRPEEGTRLARTVNEFDPDLCRSTLTALAGNGTFYVPTHVTREMDARAADAAYRSDATRKYVPRPRDAEWDRDLDRTAKSSADMARLYQAFFRHGLKITGLAHQAGVPIMAGTDANDTMIVPGFSLHRELRLLAEAGLAPMEILRAATTVPAAYLRREADLGGISPGKEADLLLLGRNPLDDIGNSASIVAVMANGRLYDRRALDALLVEAERLARSARPAP